MTASPARTPELPHPAALRYAREVLTQEGIPERLTRQIKYEIFEVEHQRNTTYASVLLRRTPGGNDGNLVLAYPAGRPELGRCAQLTLWLEGSLIAETVGFEIRGKKPGRGAAEGAYLTFRGAAGSAWAGRIVTLKPEPEYGLYLLDDPAGGPQLCLDGTVEMEEVQKLRRIGQALLRASRPVTGP